VVALAAAIVWLDSRPDTQLSHWTSVATVVSAAVSVLALAAAVIPLLHRDVRPGAEEGAEKPAGDKVVQKIVNRGSGTVNVVGKGTQNNADRGRSRNDGR
jgi:hypothetical protein